MSSLNPDRAHTEHTQILVVGFGAAGAAAAITACRLGANVVIVEKQPEHAHTPSTRMSGGMVMAVSDVDPAASYLDACAAGTDRFGRAAATLVPLSTPPYYCVPLRPGGSNTSGGPRRDEFARVLDTYGEPIPRLFAAGELGQAVGLRYPSDGSNLSEALCFGQIAAHTAVKS